MFVLSFIGINIRVIFIPRTVFFSIGVYSRTTAPIFVNLMSRALQQPDPWDSPAATG